MVKLSELVLLLQLIVYAYTALDNGLATTPPMGWCSWMEFKCEVNCTTHNTSCINEYLYKTMADHLVSDGYAAVGYKQVNIDDCWSTKQRNSSTGQQMADPIRFPNGIKGVADYVHSKGLKLGLYSDIGTMTCKGYTGIDGHYELDANTFASWNIDMIKIDGCHANNTGYYQTYPKFSQALNSTGRPIIYACSWPAYVSGNGESNPPVDNTTLYGVAKSCNTWRNHHVGQPPTMWDRISLMIDFCRRNYSEYNQTEFLNVAGPHQWNDPDQIVVGGDYGLTLSQQKTQFALWAIFAAPLIMSNDLRTINNESKAILLNKEVIDINQDALGKQGGYIWSNENQTNIVWMRELHDTPQSIAIVLQNTNNFTNSIITFSSYLVPAFVDGWNDTTKYAVRDLFNHKDLGIFHVNFSQSIQTDGVGMYKVSLAS